MKLMSMTDFVLERTNLELSKEKQNFKNLGLDIYAYVNFLKRLLELWMFIPCDENCNILEYPIFIYTNENIKKLKGI